MNAENTTSTTGNTEVKSKNPTTKPQANTNKQKSGGALLGFFVFLTFLLAIAGIGAGYYVWQQTQQQLQVAESERQALEHALSTLDENPRMQKISGGLSKKIASTNSKVQQLGKNITSLSSEQKRLASVVQDTSDIVSRSQAGWMLKEVEHVLRMSQHRLLLDRDFTGALAGLKAADQRLNDINDVRLIPIRKSIAKQTQTLNQFPHPDYTGLQLQLDNIMAQLKSGLVKQAEQVAHTDVDADKKQPPVSTENSEQTQPFDANKLWEMSKSFIVDTFDKAKSTVSDSVNVTRGEQKIALFIEEQEKKRSYDFLRNKLLGAKYSVSTRDDMAFHQQLNAALAWLENNDQFTNRASLSKEISAMNKHNLMPALPDISEPSILLAKYVNTLKDEK